MAKKIKKVQPWEIEPKKVKQKATDSLKESVNQVPDSKTKKKSKPVTKKTEEEIKVLKVHASYHKKAKVLASMQGSKLMPFVENLILDEWKKRMK